jgi:hypothetical protein
VQLSTVIKGAKMSTQNNETRWQLAGIREDKRNTEQYLQYLTEREKALSDQLLTGTPSTSSGTVRTASTPGRKPGKGGKSNVTNSTATVGKRKRTMSPEQRKLMSDAAKKRWANINAAKGQTTGTTVTAPPAGPMGEIPGSTVQ